MADLAPLPPEAVEPPFRVPVLDPPAAGAVRAVADDILWLRVPLPVKLDHVNVWLLREPDGRWTVIDTGFATEQTRDIWRGVLAETLQGAPIARVVATHMHPDHIGLAGWLCAETGADFLTTRTDFAVARMASLDTDDDAQVAQAAFYAATGLPEEVVAGYRHGGNLYARVVSAIPRRYIRLRHGDRLSMAGSDWTILCASGHAPEMVTFHSRERGVLIAADQILPQISPNVSVWANEPDADPLAEFLDGLAQYLALPEDTLVLPSHDYPFRGLHARVRDLQGHHADRLEETRAICTEAATAWEVLQRLFPRALDPQQMLFAVGETLAHLNHLIERGAVRRSWRPGSGPAGGVWCYTAIAQAG